MWRFHFQEPVVWLLHKSTWAKNDTGQLPALHQFLGAGKAQAPSSPFKAAGRSSGAQKLLGSATCRGQMGGCILLSQIVGSNLFLGDPFQNKPPKKPCSQKGTSSIHPSLLAGSGDALAGPSACSSPTPPRLILEQQGSPGTLQGDVGASPGAGGGGCQAPGLLCWASAGKPSQQPSPTGSLKRHDAKPPCSRAGTQGAAEALQLPKPLMGLMRPPTLSQAHTAVTLVTPCRVGDRMDGGQDLCTEASCPGTHRQREEGGHPLRAASSEEGLVLLVGDIPVHFLQQQLQHLGGEGGLRGQCPPHAAAAAAGGSASEEQPLSPSLQNAASALVLFLSRFANLATKITERRAVPRARPLISLGAPQETGRQMTASPALLPNFPAPTNMCLSSPHTS